MNGSDRKFSANVLKVASVVAGLTLWHLVSVYVINDSALLVSPVVVVKPLTKCFSSQASFIRICLPARGFFFTALCWPAAPVCGSASSWLSPLVRDYVNREYVELARSFRLRPWELFLKIMLPASVPFILSGIRLAVGRGLTGVAIAEWFGATEGLGYLVYFAGQTLNVPTLFVGVAAFAALGIVGFEVIRRFEAYITPWRKEAQGG